MNWRYYIVTLLMTALFHSAYSQNENRYEWGISLVSGAEYHSLKHVNEFLSDSGLTNTDELSAGAADIGLWLQHGKSVYRIAGALRPVNKHLAANKTGLSGWGIAFTYGHMAVAGKTPTTGWMPFGRIRFTDSRMRSGPSDSPRQLSLRTPALTLDAGIEKMWRLFDWRMRDDFGLGMDLGINAGTSFDIIPKRWRSDLPREGRWGGFFGLALNLRFGNYHSTR